MDFCIKQNIQFFCTLNLKFNREAKVRSTAVNLDLCISVRNTAADQISCNHEDDVHGCANRDCGTVFHDFYAACSCKKNYISETEVLVAYGFKQVIST